MDEDLSRKNLRYGWALFELFWLRFLGTAIVALVLEFSVHNSGVVAAGGFCNRDGQA